MKYVCSLCGFTESTLHLAGVYTKFDLKIMTSYKVCTVCYCKSDFKLPDLFNWRLYETAGEETCIQKSVRQ